MVRRYSALLVLLLTVPSRAEAGTDPIGIVGTWNVTSTVDISSCGTKSGVTATQWLVSSDANGQYTVKVSGDPMFTELRGKVEGSVLILASVGFVPIDQYRVAGMVQRFRLTGQGGALTGSAVASSLGRDVTVGKDTAHTYCADSYTVKATR